MKLKSNVATNAEILNRANNGDNPKAVVLQEQLMTSQTIW